jgi:hypothetical protein
MSVESTYADLEIRLLERQEGGYPVEMTLDREQEFPRGVLSPAMTNESRRPGATGGYF